MGIAHIGAVAAFAASAALAAMPQDRAAPEWKLTPAGEAARPEVPGLASISGVAWLSNGVFLAVTDHNPKVCEMGISFDGGKPEVQYLKELFSPENARDVEGIALDPSDGSLWLADEYDATVKRYDRNTGKLAGNAPVPKIMKGFLKNFSLESLSIDPGGLEMWTCNEDALECDGDRASKKAGGAVRIARFVRESQNAPWKADFQCAYRTDSISGESIRRKKRGKKVDLARCGVSEICALGGGRLLVLEREFSVVILPRFRCRIYEADVSTARDVSGVESLAGFPESGFAKKHLLYETTGLSMYEGMCLGPEAADGSRILLLVSDGDKGALQTVLALKLEKNGDPPADRPGSAGRGKGGTGR